MMVGRSSSCPADALRPTAPNLISPKAASIRWNVLAKRRARPIPRIARNLGGGGFDRLAHADVGYGAM